MSKYTKRQLEEQVDLLQHRIRRYKRAINQISIDFDKTVEVNVEVNLDRKVFPNPKLENVLKRMESEWQSNVTEPGEGGIYSPISYYIKSQSALGWDWEDDYTRNGQFAWCGAFAAAVFGDDVHLKTRKNTFSSCYRMSRDWSNSSRVQKKEDIQPGDIVTVYTSDEKSPSYGNHIVIARSAPDKFGDFHTTEGNAHGVGPDQKWREGVSKRTRNVTDVARVYRLIDEDFTK